MADSISAIPQQPQLGRLAQFLRFLETQNAPEFLPKQLDVMGLMAKLALPQASTVENLSYGNYPFTIPPAGTGAAIPQVKTGRKPEVADLVGMLGGVPGVGAVSDVTTKLSNEAADAIVRAITRNPEATATGVIRETSMPFMQAVAPRTPGLLETPVKSELGFYSALEQATMPLQNKGTGAQFLAQIEKTAGVKPEEVKWTGLDEFLKSRQNVTKQEVQDYLAANRVNLQERRLAGDGGQSPVFAEYSPDTQKFHVFSNDLRLQGLYDTAEEADAFVKQYNASIPYGPSKFSKYTLPGGENYREILLTLPRKTVQAEPLDISGFSVRTTEGTMLPYTGQRDIEVLDSAGNVVSRRSGFRGTDDEAIQNYAGTVTTQAQKADESLLNYRSSHFDQPNILAHMRVNDRVVDGKKTLFIEEIQSDWHQAGRKKGYMIPPKIELFQPQKLETSYDEFFGSGSVMADDQRLLGQINKQKNGKFKAEVVLEQNKAKDLGYFDSKEQAFDAIKNLKLYTHKKEGTMGFGEYSAFFLNEKDALASSKQSGVPDAPFKTTWHELSLKRAIQEASEKGYDQIAFTTGKTQAERYDLSKQIKTIVYGQPDESGRRTVRAITPNGDQLLGGKYTMSEIEDNIGKEMAEKIQKSTGEFDQRTGTYAMSGLDLQVGGEGMKGFYDQILPKTLDKLGKKFDAKVGKTEMDGVEVWAMNITPKMRESVLTKGQPLFAATPAVGLLGDEGE